MAEQKSDSSFSQTLQFITSIKLQELEKQRQAYKAHAKVLEEADATGDDLIKKVEILAKAIKSWTGSGALPRGNAKIVGGKLSLGNLQFWILQAKKDPSFSRDILKEWADTLEAHIRHTLLRFDCAKLFGSLFNEWLASGDSSTIPYQAGSETDDGGSEFVEVGRKEMHDQKEKLISIIFDEHPVDTQALKNYLERLFSSEDATIALERLRKETRDIGLYLQRQPISTQTVVNAINGILASGLMDEEKRTTLKSFLENPVVLDEIATVLAMRLASFDTWSWGPEGIPVEMRRHLNGKYRAFTDPDIIDGLFTQIIGIHWQVHLKIAFRKVFDSKAWKHTFDRPTHKVKERWTQQLRDDNGSRSIDAHRNRTRRLHFFLSQLSDSAHIPSTYDDLVDAPEPSSNETTSPAMIKQKLLHIMTTECYLNQTLHGSHTVIRSDLEWFGPSLPHDSILTVLEFIGFSKQWVGFYKAFLRAPLRFAGDPEVRIRKRGTPISHALSVVCGEAILFMMDFAVNQKADGLYLYRMHDDLWLWDADAKKCAAGWKEMNTYANIVGLKFNEPKTGSAVVGEGEKCEGLPAGDIRWGFLKLDEDEARFVIDQKDVDKHIVELRRQLAATKSVFGWINTYNKYMAFFLRNFGGRPANCFGVPHLTDIIDTLARIQRELFSDTQNGAIGYLQNVIDKRFGIRDMPEGYFYFPIASGGLELRNVMLEVLASAKDNKPRGVFDDEEDEDKDEDDASDEGTEDLDSDDDWFEDMTAEEAFVKKIDNDEKAYRGLKDVWDHDKDARRSESHRAEVSDEFMSFEEFTSLRESWLRGWGRRYEEMLVVPLPVEMALAPTVQAAIDSGKGWAKTTSWQNMNWYDKWIISMYGENLVKKFGGLEAVDPTLIPIGMVQLFRTSRIKLDE